MMLHGSERPSPSAGGHGKINESAQDRTEDMLDAVGGVVVATFFVCTECGGGSQTEKREPKAAQQVR